MTRRVALMLALAALLVACGRKGELTPPGAEEEPSDT